MSFIRLTETSTGKNFKVGVRVTNIKHTEESINGGTVIFVENGMFAVQEKFDEVMDAIEVASKK